VSEKINKTVHKPTNTHNHFTALRMLSGTIQVSWYQKKHSPTHTYRGNQSSLTSLISFLHLIWSMTSSLFNLRAWQSFSTISLQVFFGLPLCVAPSTSYSIHFFTQSLSSFRSTCPYHHNLFCYSTEIMSSNPSLSLILLLGTHNRHNRFTALWSLPGQPGWADTSKHTPTHTYRGHQSWQSAQSNLGIATLTMVNGLVNCVPIISRVAIINSA